MPFNPTHYQAIISDFDNTLTVNRHIPDIVQRGINNFIGTGRIFTIATGRHRFGHLLDEIQSLHINVPLVTRGGAEIVDLNSGKLIWYSHIPSQIAKRLINYLIEQEVDFSAEIENKLYLNYDPGNGSYIKGMDLLDYNAEFSTDIAKIIARPQANSLDKILEYLEKSFPKLHVTRSLGRYNYIIDVTAGNASKHLATLELCKLLQLKPDEVIGIGDSYNDYPLLSACGYKVATADAPDELKEIADEIIPPASENGILEILNRF